MNRVNVDRKVRWSLLRSANSQGADILLFAALIVVGLSYGLGYRLDWSEETGRPEDDVEVSEVMAPAAMQAAKSQTAVTDISSTSVAVAVSTIPMTPAQALEILSHPTTMSPVPVPVIRPKPADENWEKMVSQLDTLSARYPGRVSVFIKDLHSGKTWTRNPDDLFPAASLIKVPILIASFYKIKEGQLTLDEKLTITRKNRVGGSGSLKWRPDGTKISVRDALTIMINESDNTATRMILERLGIGYVQQQFPRMGLLYTGIYEEGMSIKGGRVMHENYTTAREMELLLEKIYRGEAVDKPSSDLMMEILKKPKAVASRLAKGMPSGWEIAHKTGLLRQACHDSAIFLTPNGDYAITVLTGQNASYEAAKNFITRIAHITFASYGGPRYIASVPKKRRRHDAK